MLKRCILAENRKLHASPIWILFFILPMISAAYGTFNYLQNLSILQERWYSLWTQHTLFYSLFFFPTMAFATETPRAEKKTSVAGMPFTDVEAGSWYSDAVQYVYDNKLMNGTAPTKFEPYTVMSRAMVVRILYNKSGNPEVTGDSSGFTDVNKSDWYFTAVKWAYENGYASGVGNNRFDPNADVTREQFAQFLYNYAGKQTVEGDYLSKFPDGDSVSWSKNSMNWAVSHKLINGTKENDVNYLRPQNGTTRAQAAIILRSFCLMQEGESNYAILDLNVSGQKATVQASASGACTLNIRFQGRYRHQF